jgi:Fic family protein
MNAYIYQQDDWPNFKWNSDEFVGLLSEARNLQGRLSGFIQSGILEKAFKYNN